VSAPAVIGAVELGGTHVSAARVSVDTRAIEPGTLRRDDLPPGASRERLVGAIRGAALAVADRRTRAWGVAVPGPFDYDRGVARLRGVHKLDALDGVDLRAELIAALGLAGPGDVRFVNDAGAFLVGEWWAGAAAAHRGAIGITLGSRLGSAFLRDGALVTQGHGVPPDSRLDLVPFRGRPAEETLSRRGLVRAYAAVVGERVEPVEIARRARSGDARAREAFARFGTALGELLSPWVDAFGPDSCVFGGSISRAWDLFGPELLAASPPARRLAYAGVATHLDEAPLLGAARHAIAAPS